ncbi:MAG: hypothetical protein M1827_004610 [Pycnora praestabilis]|nr:MAG: hypothetical protein M1827_004610 [Pycnora praestabilis]
MYSSYITSTLILLLNLFILLISAEPSCDSDHGRPDVDACRNTYNMIPTGSGSIAFAIGSLAASSDLIHRLPIEYQFPGGGLSQRSKTWRVGRRDGIVIEVNQDEEEESASDDEMFYEAMMIGQAGQERSGAKSGGQIAAIWPKICLMGQGSCGPGEQCGDFHSVGRARYMYGVQLSGSQIGRCVSTFLG